MSMSDDIVNNYVYIADIDLVIPIHVTARALILLRYLDRVNLNHSLINPHKSNYIAPAANRVVLSGDT